MRFPVVALFLKTRSCAGRNVVMARRHTAGRNLDGMFMAGADFSSSKRPHRGFYSPARCRSWDTYRGSRRPPGDGLGTLPAVRWGQGRRCRRNSVIPSLFFGCRKRAEPVARRSTATFAAHPFRSRVREGVGDLRKRIAQSSTALRRRLRDYLHLVYEKLSQTVFIFAGSTSRRCGRRAGGGPDWPAGFR